MKSIDTFLAVNKISAAIKPFVNVKSIDLIFGYDLIKNRKTITAVVFYMQNEGKESNFHECIYEEFEILSLEILIAKCKVAAISVSQKTKITQFTAES